MTWLLGENKPTASVAAAVLPMRKLRRQSPSKLRNLKKHRDFALRNTEVPRTWREHGEGTKKHRLTPRQLHPQARSTWQHVTAPCFVILQVRSFALAICHCQNIHEHPINGIFFDIPTFFTMHTAYHAYQNIPCSHAPSASDDSEENKTWPRTFYNLIRLFAFAGSLAICQFLPCAVASIYDAIECHWCLSRNAFLFAVYTALCLRADCVWRRKKMLRFAGWCLAVKKGSSQDSCPKRQKSLLRVEVATMLCWSTDATDPLIHWYTFSLT